MKIIQTIIVMIYHLIACSVRLSRWCSTMFDGTTEKKSNKSEMIDSLFFGFITWIRMWTCSNAINGTLKLLCVKITLFCLRKRKLKLVVKLNSVWHYLFLTKTFLLLRAFDFRLIFPLDFANHKESNKLQILLRKGVCLIKLHIWRNHSYLENTLWILALWESCRLIMINFSVLLFMHFVHIFKCTHISDG